MSLSAAVTDVVRFPSLAPSPSSSLKDSDMPAPLRFDATLAFVEKAAEMIRSLRHELEASRAQGVALRKQIQQERLQRQDEADKIHSMVEGWYVQLKTAQNDVSEARALAADAVARCESMAERELKSMQQVKAAEARAVAAESWLAELHRTMESEFSSLLS